MSRFRRGCIRAQRGGKPDISSVDAFKRTLLLAKSIAHADPARGGVTAIYVAKLLSGLDIAAEIKPKITLFPPGVATTAQPMARSKSGFGVQAKSSLIRAWNSPGPLPAAIQNYTVFAGGIVANTDQYAAGKALLEFMASAAAAAVMRRKALSRCRPFEFARCHPTVFSRHTSGRG